MIEEISSIVMLVIILLVLLSTLVSWRIGYHQGRQSVHDDDYNNYVDRSQAMSGRSMWRRHKPY